MRVIDSSPVVQPSGCLNVVRSVDQRTAVAAIVHCRTAALSGQDPGSGLWLQCSSQDVGRLGPGPIIPGRALLPRPGCR